MSNITVVGAGAFGTSLALYSHSLGHSVKVWCFEKDLPEIVTTNKENSTYLPGLTIPAEIPFTNDAEAASKDADLLLFVTPSAHLRKTLQLFKEYLSTDMTILCATKGIEHGSNMLMSQLVEEELADLYESVAFLSGPSFAKDIAMGYPADFSCASKKIETARKVQTMLHSPKFRIYTCDDVLGVELGGSLKNVIAIASGVCDGLGLGLSARAALITRGLSEMVRLGVAMGAKPITFQGLSGVGDLILTCTGDLSRNRTLGKKLAEGKSAAEVVSSQKAVAEGYVTAKPVHELAEQYNTEMPVSEAVYRVCYENADLQATIKELMSRAQKDEFQGIE